MLSAQAQTVARLQCVTHLAVLSLRLHDLFRQADLDPDIGLGLISQHGGKPAGVASMGGGKKPRVRLRVCVQPFIGLVRGLGCDPFHAGQRLQDSREILCGSCLRGDTCQMLLNDGAKFENFPESPTAQARAPRIPAEASVRRDLQPPDGSWPPVEGRGLRRTGAKVLPAAGPAQAGMHRREFLPTRSRH
jgi:hypothetical protein